MFLLMPMVMLLAPLPLTEPTRDLTCAAPTSSLKFAAQVAASPIDSRSIANSALKASTVELWRADDGLFYVEGRINGQPVRFLVDTGASLVVLTSHDAARIGVGHEPGGGIFEADTATGKSAMARVTLGSVEVGATASLAVDAAIAREGLAVSLLGQNWLSRLSSVTIEGDRMLLR